MVNHKYIASVYSIVRIGKDRRMAAIMGNVSVHSHNSVPVADS